MTFRYLLLLALLAVGFSNFSPVQILSAEEKDKEEEEEDIMRDCEGGRSPAGHRACNLSWLSSSHLACFSLRVGPGRAELDNQWPYRYSLKYLYNTTVMIHIDSLSTVYLYGRPRSVL